MSKDKGIKLSPKFGVNPSIIMCAYCDKELGIALLGKLPNDKEAPKYMIDNELPCEHCVERLEKEQATMIIEVIDEKTRELSGRYVEGPASNIDTPYAPFVFMVKEQFQELFHKEGAEE